MTIDEYIQSIRSAINDGARQFYFPPSKARRKSANLRLAREIAWGLQDFPAKEIKYILGSLYGQLVVIFSLDSTGVCISAKDFTSEIRRALPKAIAQAL